MLNITFHAAMATNLYALMHAVEFTVSLLCIHGKLRVAYKYSYYDYSWIYLNSHAYEGCMPVPVAMNHIIKVNQKLLYRESDWWYVGLVVQKARKQGTVC